jgi:hypothetical protein
MRMQSALMGVAVVATCGSLALATTIQVGPGRTYTTVAAGYNAASDGDTIEIDSGTYTGPAAACVTIYKNNLTFRGVGATRPVLDAAGGNVGDKGIFVVYANNLTVQNLEMKNCAGPSGNDAGIRYQPQTRYTPALLTVQNCYIHDNQDGVLTDGDNNGIQISVVFDSTEFNHNGYGDGQTHNMYIGPCTSFTLRYCYSHDTIEGHEVKTRALKNYILYNLLSSENGSGSRELELTQGGTCYVIGNVIQQGPNSDNSTIIAYGPESNNPNPYLYVVNNTIINLRPNGATFLQVSDSPNEAVLQNNIMQWYGYETLIGGTYAGQVVQTSNWVTTNAALANIAAHDYHLTTASTGAINLGTAPGTGHGGVSLVPIYEYAHPCSYVNRPTDSVIDIGAFEYAAPNNPPTVDAGADQDVYEGQLVQLHATGSDPDSDPLAYAWTQLAGLTVSLSGANAADASFTAPAVATVAQASMTFRVTVNDGKGGTANDSVNVRVYLAGDATHNDAVDVSDLLAVAEAWNSIAGQPRYDPACDFNNDGLVDTADLLMLGNNWGNQLQ